MESSSLGTLGKIPRIFLLIISLLISVGLLLVRTHIDSDKPLDFLARNSLDPEIALQNGHPTIIEFYADWCEACQTMAAPMVNIKSKYEDEIDIVLLNVDNQRWLDLLQKYEVNGIPHMNFFDENGMLKGSSIGIKGNDQLNQLVISLLNSQPFPDYSGVNNNETSDLSFSTLKKEPSLQVINPRSHS